jgi:hypothetical protein
MDEAAAGLIVTKKAQYRGMIAIRHRGEELKALREEKHFRAMLILSSYKQVEIRFPAQNRVDAPAALPIAIGDIVTMKFRKGSFQHRQGQAVRAWPR